MYGQALVDRFFAPYNIKVWATPLEDMGSAWVAERVAPVDVEEILAANVSTVDITDPKDLVRRGYDAVSLRYDEAYGAETKYQSLLGDLCQRIPAGGTVLDLGCGSGVPVARTLAAVGYRVTGIDISEVQIRRARERWTASRPGRTTQPPSIRGWLALNTSRDRARST